MTEVYVSADVEADGPIPGPHSMLSFASAAILLIHGAGASVWWWAMPKGFPWNHPRFWANQVLPVVILLAAGIGLWAIATRRARVVQCAALGVAIFWSASMAVAAFVFPVSRSRFLLPLGGVVAICWFAYWVWPAPRRLSGFAAFLVGLVALAAGALAPLTQKAPEASTSPIGGQWNRVESRETSTDSEPMQISENLQVVARDGMVHSQFHSLSIQINPLLTFISCSPDRCWTILAPPRRRVRPARILTGKALKGAVAELEYAGDARHLLRVSETGPLPGCMIEAKTQLDEDVYSHLNSCCELAISGHRKLSLAFSPCPDLHVSVEPSDYPIGRPARFAYRDHGGSFYIVEASSGEKGPFNVLGSGPLAPGDELQMTLYDESIRVASVTFSDWARQCSTELSPTAGWGVPMNAIEFRRLGESDQAPVAIWCTLAGTSIGRGWDSVGHRAGIYRNRIRITGGSERASVPGS